MMAYIYFKRPNCPKCGDGLETTYAWYFECPNHCYGPRDHLIFAFEDEREWYEQKEKENFYREFERLEREDERQHEIMIEAQAEIKRLNDEREQLRKRYRAER